MDAAIRPEPVAIVRRPRRNSYRSFNPVEPMFRSAIPAVLFLAATILVSPMATAQVFLQMGQQPSTGRVVEPPRSLIQLLKEAERAIEQNRPSDAVVILGDLLQRQPSADNNEGELTGQDFFMDVGDPVDGGDRFQRRPPLPPAPGIPGQPRGQGGGDPNRPTSIGQPLRKTLIGEARRLLASLPAAALDTYELRYGVDAKGLLEKSAASRNWDGVAEVRRRYFHTRSGLDATRLLAQRSVSLGRPLEAVRLFEAILEHPRLNPAERDSIELMIRANRRWSLTGTNATPPNEDRAAAPAAGDAPASGKAEPKSDRPLQVQLAGESVTTPGADAFPAWLEERFRLPRSRNRGAVDDVLMFGGDGARGETGVGQMPLSMPRWMARAVETPSQQRELEEFTEAMSASGEFVPPSWMPIKVGDQVLMRSVGYLYGIDFKTGKVIWQKPWFETEQEAEAPDPTDGLIEEADGDGLIRQRVWNDLPYGRISSDGKRVYMLDDLSEIEIASFNPLMGFQGARPAESNANKLIALEIATQGKLAWEIGGKESEEQGWGDVFFLGPPLPLGDALYVMAETSGDIILLCLDAATGIERWRQQLVAVEAGGVHSDPVRRIAGAVPSHQDGVLICSTGTGVVVAVDLIDQSLTWAARFERNEALNQQLMVGGRREMSADRLMQRWWDGTPRIVGNTIYVTPIESDRLFAFDLLTGEKRWKEIPRSQRGSRYFGGVREGKMLLVGSDHVRAIDASSAQRLWDTPTEWLETGEHVAGVGVFGVQPAGEGAEPLPAYFVPTTASRIIAVSLADGAVIASRQTQFPPGNLVALEGQLLCQSPTTLSAVYGERSLTKLTGATLESDPNNYDAVVWQAELLLQKGSLDESLRWLNRAREMNPDDVHVEDLSIRAMLNSLREDFSGNLKILPELEKLIYRPSDKVELRKLQVRAALQEKDYKQAIGRLTELSDLVTADLSLKGLEKLGMNEPQLQVAMDDWIAARAAECVAGAGETGKGEIDQAVADFLGPLKTAQTTRLDRLFAHFGRLDGAATLADGLIDRYGTENNFLRLERLVLTAGDKTTETAAGLPEKRLTALIGAYARGGLVADAAKLWSELPAEKRTPELAESLGFKDPQIKWIDEGRVPEAWASKVRVVVPENENRIRGTVMGRPLIGKTKRLVGQTFKGWRVIGDQSSPLSLRDPMGIVFPITISSRREDPARQAAFSGGLMIAMSPSELIGVNMFEAVSGQGEPILWRRPLRGDGADGVKSKSSPTDFGDEVYRYIVNGSGGDAAGELVLGPILGNSFYVLQGGELVAYDAMTAEPRWRNLDTPGSGVIVASGNTVAIVAPGTQATPGKIVTYDRYDGRRIAEQPFADFQVWASTDSKVLAYRNVSDQQRELVLLDPISGDKTLTHTFDDVAGERRVFGRVIDGTYMVTLSAKGEILAWDIERGRKVAELKVDAIPNLRGVQVIARKEQLIVLPRTDETPSEPNALSIHTHSGQDHVRVDGNVIAIGIEKGELLWTVPLGPQPWGCTLTQASGSPLLLLSRSKTKFETTGTRAKTLDVMAIDTRDGKNIPSLDQPIESFNNEIETLLTCQPSQQKVSVGVGSVRLEYVFEDGATQPTP